MKAARRPQLNPVLRRELLERWRSRRAPLTLTLYLAVLGAILYLLYRIGLAMATSQMGFGGPMGGMGMGMGGPDASVVGPLLGRFLFESLLFFVLLLVLFVAPGYAAAQLSGERERRTLGLLQMTLLSPLQIVLGKLGASVAWLTLLVVATVPLGAAAFFLGGVGVGDLVRGIGYILVIAICVAAMAIGISSMTKRTTGSIVLTYGLILALTAGSTFVGIAELVLRAQRGERMRGDVPVALYLNPVIGLADAVTATPLSMSFFGGLQMPSPLSVAAEALVTDDDAFRRGAMEFEDPMMVEPGFLATEPPVFDDGMGFEVPPVARRAEPSRTWLQIMGIYIALGIAGLALAHARLRGRQVSARVGRRGQPTAAWTPPAATGPAAPEPAASAPAGPDQP